jgi:hypothetical protein
MYSFIPLALGLALAASAASFIVLAIFALDGWMRAPVGRRQ